MTRVCWLRRCLGSTVSLAVWMTVLIVLANADARAETEETADAPNTWYATTVVSGRSGYRSTNYWSKGPALRSQTVLGIHPVVTIVRGDRYWVYDVLEHAQMLEHFKEAPKGPDSASVGDHAGSCHG